MAQVYNDPLYTEFAESFDQEDITLVNGYGTARTYKLYTEFRIERSSNAKVMQGQYQKPVQWTRGQQEGPCAGSFKLACASWYDAEDVLFLGQDPLFVMLDCQTAVPFAGGRRLYDISGMRIKRWSKEGSEGGEPTYVSVDFEALSHRLRGTEPSTAEGQLAVSVSVAVPIG